MINHTYMGGGLHKAPIVWGSESFQIGEYIHPNSLGKGDPALGAPPDIICSSVSVIIHFNTWRSVRKRSLELCELLQQIN